jgi:hypothetical protein
MQNELKLVEKTRFTKGPWRYLAHSIKQETSKLAGLTGKDIAHIAGDTVNVFSKDYEESIANAKLIAAAPELYIALDELLTEIAMLYKNKEKPEARFKAEKALLKARGELF